MQQRLRELDAQWWENRQRVNEPDDASVLPGLQIGGVLLASALSDSGGLSSVNTAPAPVAPDNGRLLTAEQPILVARYTPPRGRRHPTAPVRSA